MILTAENRQLTDGSSIHLTDLSIGLSATRTLFIVVDEPLGQLSVDMPTDSAFSLFKVNDGVVDVVDSLGLVDVDLHQTGGKYVYVVNIMAFSEVDGFFTSTVSINVNGLVTNLNLKVDIVGMDSNLVIALQNMKVFLSDDWMKSMFETEVDSKSIDFVVYNKKLREYLMNIMDLEILKGTYKGLESALNFFGFGELLDIKEHWINKEGGDYKYTSIRNAILTKVDKNLTGYKKTNQMSLVYQINTEQGIDDDALPIYINVLEDTDKILAKLWVMEKILEREFLYTNTHIVDIIGEFQAVVGLEFSFILNTAGVTDVNLNKDLFGKIQKVGGSPETQIMTNLSLILYKNFVLKETNEILDDVEGITNSSVIDTEKYYEVLEIVGEDSEEGKDFDILTRFHNTDCAPLFLEVEFVDDTYQSFKYFIFDEHNDIVFTSAMRGVDTIRNNRITCAVKKLGRCKMVCYFFDYSGGVSIISVGTEILPVTPKISLGVYGLDGTMVNIEHWSTFDTFKEGMRSPVAQNLNDGLNINTWDSVENTPQQIVARYYANVFDQVSTWTSINELNSIPISEYAHLPVNIHGHSYATIILDIIPNVGNNSVGVAYFEYDDFDSVDLNWDGVEPITQWLTKLSALLNIQQDNKLADFTWSLHRYSNNPLANIEDAHYVIVAKSVDLSLMSEHVRVLNTGQLREGYEQNYFKDDVRAWSVVDAVTRFAFTPSDGLFDVTIGDFVHQSEQNFTDFESFRSVLDDLINSIKGVWAIYDGNEVLIYSSSDIYLKHNSIGGVQRDVVRAIDSNSIVAVSRGTDITIGEPIFAHIKKETLQDLYDPKWTLIRENDNKLITVQNSIWFRSVVTRKGSYTLKFQYKDPMGVDKEFLFSGCFIVGGGR